MSGITPKLATRQTRVRTQFVNGLHVGGTEINAETLANIATVSALDPDDLEALSDSAETLAVVGDETDGLVKDVDDLQTAVTDLTHVAMLDFTEDLAAGHTYTYDSTPTGDVTATVTAGKTCAVITPGGSTAHALTFTLPVAAAANVFKVTYDLGTHTGTVIIGGVTVTGSGFLHFFWDGESWATWETNAYTITLPDKCTGILLGLSDAGSSNTVEIVLATGAANENKCASVCVVLTATTGSACTANVNGNIITSAGAVTSVDDVANGSYLLHCVAADLWAPAGAIAVNT